MTDDLHDLIGSLARVQGLEWVAADDDSVRLRHPDSAAEARLQLESIRRLPYPIDGPQLRACLEDRLQEARRALLGEPRAEENPLLLPLLRPPEAPGQPHWSRSEAQGRLSLLLVEDHGSHLHIFKPMDLVNRGIPVARLQQTASHNLRTRSSPDQLDVHPTLACLHSFAHDGFDAARALIAHHLIEDPRGLLVLIPSRDHLWLIPASEAGALSRALRLRQPAADLARSQTRPISAEIFWQHQGVLTHLPLRRGPAGLEFMSLPSVLID